MQEENIQIQVVGLREAMARIDKIKSGLKMAPRVAVHSAAQVIERALQANAPEHKSDPLHPGHEFGPTLKESIEFKLVERGHYSTAVFTAKPTAKFVIEGTAAHDIWAGFYTGKSDKKFLAFTSSGGEAMFTPYVHHPGTKPNDFRKKAWVEVREIVMQILRHTGNAVIRGELIREMGGGI